MKICVAFLNKPQIATGFFLEALKVADQFHCRLGMRFINQRNVFPEGFHLLPIELGRVPELEIAVDGDHAGKAMDAIRSLMARQLSDAAFDVN
jgi:hypothetical protein